MNFGTLQTYLVNNVLARKGDSDLTALAPVAINQAKLEIQRTHEYGIMESHLTIRQSGAVIDNTIKRVCEVNVLNQDGTVNHQVLPATRDEIRMIRTTVRPVSTWEMFNASAAVFCQQNRIVNKWWIQEGRLFLSDTIPPTAIVRADTYALLPDYEDDEDEDWFSIWGYDALAYKAAEIGFAFGVEDDQLAMFRQLGAEKIMQLQKLDNDMVAGGDAMIVRPSRNRYGAGGIFNGTY
jgi:hypothetical protein